MNFWTWKGDLGIGMLVLEQLSLCWWVFVCQLVLQVSDLHQSSLQKLSSGWGREPNHLRNSKWLCFSCELGTGNVKEFMLIVDLWEFFSLHKQDHLHNLWCRSSVVLLFVLHQKSCCCSFDLFLWTLHSLMHFPPLSRKCLCLCEIRSYKYCIPFPAS